MKNAFLASLVGLAVVIALDSFIRIIIAVSTGIPIPMISYEEFDFIWSLVITIFAGITAFLGAMVSLKYGRNHKIMTVILFVLLMILIRYGQIHLLYPQETLFYPVTALILSLAGIFLAWHLTSGKDKPDKKPKEKLHHYPANSDEHSGS